jgi:hypothetical protein
MAFVHRLSAPIAETVGLRNLSYAYNLAASLYLVLELVHCCLNFASDTNAICFTKGLVEYKFVIELLLKRQFLLT